MAFFQKELNLVMKIETLYPGQEFPVVIENATENAMKLKLFSPLDVPVQTHILLMYTDTKFEYRFHVQSVIAVTLKDVSLITTKPMKVEKAFKRVFIRMDVNVPGHYQRWDGQGDRHEIVATDISGGGCNFITDSEVLMRDLLRFGARLSDDIRLANICGKVARVMRVGDNYPVPDLFLGVDRESLFEVGLQFTIIPNTTVARIVEFIDDQLGR